MFERSFHKIDGVLWKVAGCAAVPDYAERSSSMLFLKRLRGFEQSLPQKTFSAKPSAIRGAVNAILNEAKAA